MSDHDDTLPMLQMLEHAREAVEMIRGRARGEVISDRLLQLALAHLVLLQAPVLAERVRPTRGLRVAVRRETRGDHSADDGGEDRLHAQSLTQASLNSR